MNLVKQEIRFCTSADGVRIAFATAGAGPPLVKAANWFSHIEYDWRMPVWHHWHAALAHNHTYYRYDRRGCGLSDWDPLQTFEGYCLDLEAVVSAAQLERFALFGMGHGGSIAVAYAARHPERVSHLVLYGPMGRGRYHRNPSAAQLSEIELNLKLAEVGWGSDDPAFRQFFTSQFMPEATAEQMRSFAELQRISTSAEFAVKHLRAVFDIDASDFAPAVRCPTLVLHARGDLRIPFEEGRRLASLIPQARFVPLEGRNHFLHESDPAWQEFLTELRAFLPRGRQPGPSGFGDLTPREVEVLELLSHALDNAQIAAWLSLSEKTVRNHITAIFAKLEVATRAQAIVRARDAGYPHEPLNTRK
jgi:pimeloyl-ACP methyl ester carboxylesterase/DNA-binding CsgD family transcriptional regulator